MSTENSGINLFEYYDYRKYLYDWYEYKKKKNKGISYRFISTKINVDAGYLVKIMQGQKHLNPEKVSGLARFFKFSKAEEEYFELLIHFAKAKTEERIKFYFEKLLTYTSLNVETVEPQRYEFYQKWYHTAIREIVNCFPVSDNYEETGRMLLPQISASKVESSIELLKQLNFIEKNSKGFYKQTSAFITTGDSWRSIAIRSFHREVINLALQAVGNIPPSERDLSCITLSLSDDDFESLQIRIKEFREDVLRLCKSHTNVNRVYHLNMQLFPITYRVDDED